VKRMAPFLHVLYPTFDRPAAAAALVRQLEDQSYPDFGIVCVDHGTTPAALASTRRPLAVLRARPELWWTGAMNAGLDHILASAGAGDAVVTINDDVRIEPGYLAALAAAAEARPRALVGSVCIDDAADRVLYADLRFRRLRGYFASPYAGRSPEEVPRGRLLPCDVHSGRGTLIPTAVFREAGLYDDARLPHYGADYELSRRARDRGYELLCATDARVRTGPPPPDTSAGYRSFLEFATDHTKAGRVPDKWAFHSRCFGRRYALWACALEVYRLGRIYARERWLGGSPGAA
jgi:GT2 family glycosyltransferase